MQNGFNMMLRSPRQAVATLKNNVVDVATKSDFVRDVTMLLSGTAIAQVVTIAIGPILSRLYDPSAFGVFALFTSMLSILSVVAALNYEYAIVLPDNESDAANVLVLACIVVGGTTLLSWIFIEVAGSWVSHALSSDQLKPWLRLLPVSIMMIGLFNALNYWSTRRRHYKRLSISQVLRSVASAGTQTSAGFAGVGAFGLIGGQIIGQIMATATLAIQVWRDERQLVRDSLSLKKIRALAKTYADFPRYSSVQTLLNSLSQNLSPFLLAYFFNSVAVGLYALSLRFLQIPFTLLGQSVRQVFYQKANDTYIQGSVYPLLKKATWSLFVIGIIPTLIISLFGPQLFAIILGSKWLKAGLYAQFMMPWLFLSLVNRPSITMIPILNVQSFYAVYEAVFLVCRALALALGGILSNDVIAIGAYSIVGLAFQLYIILYVFRLTKRHERNPVKRSYDKDYDRSNET